MRKCLALYFEKGFNKAYHSKLVKDLFVQCRKGLNPTYQYPKQVFERIAPGKFIRNYTKETLRRADRTKIREIVSAIFLKKQIKNNEISCRSSESASTLIPMIISK